MLLLQVILIALNAVFACAEIAVIQMNENKLNKLVSKGDKRAKRLSKLTAEPAKFLATIQVAITLSGYLGSAFAAENFSGGLVDWLIRLGVSIPRKTLDTLAIVLITLILSYFTLIFGELVPKRVAMRKTESLALGVSGLIGGISVIFKPIVWFLSISTNAVLRLLGIDPNEEEDSAGEEEIRMMVDASSEKGMIDHDEKEFIQNVFEFDDKTAEEIATHRTEIDLLWLDESMDEWAKTIYESRHTLYPVCEDSADQVVGILNAKDYFRLSDRSRDNVIRNAVRPAYFVPDSVKADVLFRNMKRTRNSMAVVLDEYGGMVGIVTLNDLVEQLVGDLDDDDETPNADTPHISASGEGSWEIYGNVELRDVEESLSLTIEQDEYDTFSGLVFSHLGLIPEDGPSNIELDAYGMHVHVSEVRDHQIAHATVRLVEPIAASEDE